jgi:hypothetical protein
LPPDDWIMPMLRPALSEPPIQPGDGMAELSSGVLTAEPALPADAPAPAADGCVPPLPLALAMPPAVLLATAPPAALLELTTGSLLPAAAALAPAVLDALTPAAAARGPAPAPAAGVAVGCAALAALGCGLCVLGCELPPPQAAHANNPSNAAEARPTLRSRRRPRVWLPALSSARLIVSLLA